MCVNRGENGRENRKELIGQSEKNEYGRRLEWRREYGRHGEENGVYGKRQAIEKIAEKKKQNMHGERVRCLKQNGREGRKYDR